MAKQVHLVRLKPVQPNKGITVQRYSFRGALYDGKHGWYRITDVNLVRELQRLTQKEHDPESPKLFDVATEEEAAEIDRRERTTRGSAAMPTRAPGRSMASGERARPRRNVTSTADLREEDEEDPPPAPKPPRSRAAEPEPEEDEVGKMDDDDSGFEEDEESDDGPDVVVDGADDEEEGDDVGKIDNVDVDHKEHGERARRALDAGRAPKPASKKKAKPKPRKRS